MAELGFWETLIIVIAPIIIGAISTHFLSRSWQVYQHKIKLKQELIDLYNESTVSLWSSQISLVAEILKTFTRGFSTYDESDISSVKSNLVFPNNPKEELEKVFFPKYIELSKLIPKTDDKRNLLTIRLGLYTDNKTIFKQLEEITVNIFKHRIEIGNLIQSKTLEDFLTVLNKINDIRDNLKPKAKELTSSFVGLKIKTIPI